MPDRPRPSPWQLGARSETGFVREANEDRMGWVRTAFGDVFLVSDGMGGHNGGALAAEIAVSTLQEQLARIAPGADRFTDQVRLAFQQANRAVHERRQADDPDTHEMGATAVALVSDGQRFIVAHVGDSRAYLWRRGQLRPLTRDHTTVQDLLDQGLLSAGQAAAHPDASVLSRAIGHLPGVQADVTDWQALQPGDLLLLCSDGLCGFVPDAEIAAVLAEGGEAQALVDRLIRAALDKGGQDNVTVQLLRYAPAGGALRGALAALRPSTLLAIGITAGLCALVAWPTISGYRQQIAVLEAAKVSQAAPASTSSAADQPAKAKGKAAQ